MQEHLGPHSRKAMTSQKIVTTRRESQKRRIFRMKSSVRVMPYSWLN
jgi:hypothetical protein